MFAPAVENARSRIDTSGDARWRFEVADALTFLQSYPFTGDELVYCDPPYVHSTRTRANMYQFELTDVMHVDLLETLKSLPCRVMVSGYHSELYARHLIGWRAINFEAMTRGGCTKTEWLWMNFPAPRALHDYQFLGDDFRDRERIRKKVNRWKAKLERLPELERRAILDALT